MPRFGLIAVIAISAILALNCSEDTITPPQPVKYPTADSMQWSSIEVIWNSDSTKNPYSLLVFGATWCSWCHKLMNTTFADSEVMGLVNEYFNACVIDIDQESLLVVNGDTITCQATANRYGIISVPTTIFFDREGNKLVKLPGYYAPDAFADILWRVVQGDY